MNRQDLVNEVYEALGEKTPKKLIEAVITAEENVKLAALQRGEKVQLIGFGTYETRHRNARKGRNPQTGEQIDIPAQDVIAFKAGKHARGIIN